MKFTSLGSSKREIYETDFFDILTIQNDQISYVKDVLAPFYVVFTLFGGWGGGLPRWLGHNGTAQGGGSGQGVLSPPPPLAIENTGALASAQRAILRPMVR